MKQYSFTDAEQTAMKKTRKQLTLEKMDKVAPWSELVKLLEPHYYKSGRVGRQPYPLEVMIRVMFIQNWYGLSDQGCEEYLAETPFVREFIGISSIDRIPDENTILNFRHFLEQHNLQEAMFAAVSNYLTEQGLVLSRGKIVDATIIEAARSTKNKARARDPEMSSVAKGKQWFWGMKFHTAADAKTGMITKFTCTTASVHDSQVLKYLVASGDSCVYGDKAYDTRQCAEQLSQRGITNRIHTKLKKNHTLAERQRINEKNRELSKIRCRGEHAYAIIKCRFGFRKTRYKGLKKNAQKLAFLAALANLYLAAPRLLVGT